MGASISTPWSSLYTYRDPWWSRDPEIGGGDAYVVVSAHHGDIGEDADGLHGWVGLRDVAAGLHGGCGHCELASGGATWLVSFYER